MRECTIQRESRGELEIVRLIGALDAVALPRLIALLDELRGRQRHRVILDCEMLDYISSAALGTLVGFIRRAHEDSGELMLAAVSPDIMRIIELLGFHRLFRIFPDLPAAVAAAAG